MKILTVNVVSLCLALIAIALMFAITIYKKSEKVKGGNRVEKSVHALSLCLSLISIVLTFSMFFDKKDETLKNINWSEKSVQIEQLMSDGVWYPREPLPLDKQLKIQRSEVDFSVSFMMTKMEEKVLLSRFVEVKCKGNNTKNKEMYSSFVLNEKNMNLSSEINCGGSQWRINLVNKVDVKEPTIAGPGQLIENI